VLCTAIKLYWAASYVFGGLKNNMCLLGTGVKQLEGLVQLGIETGHLLALLFIDLSHNFSQQRERMVVDPTDQCQKL